MNATPHETPIEARATARDLARGADPLTPGAQGLYDPAREHDTCGVGFVADMKNRKSHAILERASRSWQISITAGPLGPIRCSATGAAS